MSTYSDAVAALGKLGRAIDALAEERDAAVTVALKADTARKDAEDRAELERAAALSAQAEVNRLTIALSAANEDLAATGFDPDGHAAQWDPRPG